MTVTPGEALTVQTKIRNPNPNVTQLSITSIDPGQEAGADCRISHGLQLRPVPSY